MQTSFFFGAGASVSYGMPTTGGFMDRLRGKGRDRRRWREVSDALGASSIEELFDGLADTARYAGTGAGRSVLSLLDPDRGRGLRRASDIARLEAALERRVFEAYRWRPENAALLRAIHGTMLGLAGEQDVVPVYTTNYDRCVEEYCSDPHNGILCNDGFREDQFAGRFRWPNAYRRIGAGGAGEARTVNLYKIHGSLGWKLGPYGPERMAYESRSDSPHYGDLLVYPSSRSSPLTGTALFEAIFSGFKDSLLSSDACVAVGYSFRDSRVAEVFTEFVRGGRLLVAVGDRAAPDLYKHVVRAPVPTGASEKWRRAGPGRAIRLDPSMPSVYAVNELVGPETALGIVRGIGGILHKVGGPVIP